MMDFEVIYTLLFVSITKAIEEIELFPVFTETLIKGLPV